MTTEPTLSPVRILVVDDNPTKRLALTSVLAPLGHEIVEAGSGVEALRCVMAQDFAVILLDIRMPIMDGFETAGLIRQRRESEMTPIIFVTAYGRDEVAGRNLYADDAVDFIYGGVAPGELRGKVTFFVNLFIKAEALAARARDVQDSADQLRLLTDAAPIGIFQTDAQNRYVYTNPFWSEITGITKAAAAGTICEIMTLPGAPEDVTLEVPYPDVEPAERRQRVRLTLPGSTVRTVVATFQAIPDGRGGVAGWVGTLADISAEANAQAVLAEARDKANEASQLKSDFLANMSHEIRTPMNGVIGMTSLLLETDLDVQQRDFAETVRTSGEALMTIIDDILDFSKIEAGMLEVESLDFAVRAIVGDVVKLLEGSAKDKGLDLSSVVDPSVPTVVRGDPGRLRQVLTNLVGNAVKFTKAGSIVVRVAADRDAAGEVVVRFAVTDTGEGIAPDKLQTVFEPFVQADTSTSRTYGGTGLGLAISSELVALMGGDCGVDSELAVGSTFWFTILVKATAGRPRAAVAAGPNVVASDPVRGGRLLLVEDNEINQRVAVAMLTGAGYDVDTVPNGRAAVDAHARTRYDAILMDCQMPELNGYEATASVRATEGTERHTPIIAMTAGARVEDRERCLASGMDDYVAKPVRKELLLAAVSHWLGSTTAPVGEAPVIASAETEPTLDATVFEQLRVLGGADRPDFTGELVDSFLRDTRPALAALRTAVECADAAEVGRYAHQIKGSSAQLGGRRLAASCERLERASRATGLDGGGLQDVEVDYDDLCEAFVLARGAPR
ncbi:MAG: two-component system, sensor histidine kinase and response regulator [Acidimicrobiaceae bacterium]